MLSKLSTATGRVGRGVLRAVAARPAPARALALGKRNGGICGVFSAPPLWSQRRGLATQSPNVLGVPHPLNPSPDTPNPDKSNVKFPDITMTEAHAAGKTIVELITSDHRCVEKLFATFNAKETIDADKQIAAWKVIRELSIHACVEEELLYQILKTLGPEGQKYYDHSVKEHSDLKKILYELDEINCDPKNDKTATLMQHAETANKHHVKEEESEVLPFMEKKLDKEKLKAMGKQYCEYKPMMPTRPHPMAPVGSYLGDRALHLADAVKDKVRFANVKGYMEDPTCSSSGAAHSK